MLTFNLRLLILSGFGQVYLQAILDRFGYWLVIICHITVYIDWGKRITRGGCCLGFDRRCILHVHITHIYIHIYSSAVILRFIAIHIIDSKFLLGS